MNDEAGGHRGPRRLAALAVVAAVAVLTACGGAPSSSGSSTSPESETGSAAATGCLGSQPCYTPQQFRVAYGIQPLLDRGIDGRGVTVALPEEAETGPAQTPAAVRHSEPPVARPSAALALWDSHPTAPSSPSWFTKRRITTAIGSSSTTLLLSR